MTTVHHRHDTGVVLCDRCAGRWVCLSESGTAYVLDLNAGTQRRVPAAERVVEFAAAGGRMMLGDDEVLPAGVWRSDGPHLRRDGDEVPLIAFDPVRLGAPLVMVLQVVEDGPQTVRPTTPVVAVVCRDGAWVLDARELPDREWLGDLLCPDEETTS